MRSVWTRKRLHDSLSEFRSAYLSEIPHHPELVDGHTQPLWQGCAVAPRTGARVWHALPPGQMATPMLMPDALSGQIPLESAQATGHSCAMQSVQCTGRQHRNAKSHHGLVHGAEQHQVRQCDLIAHHVHPRPQVLVDLREQYSNLQWTSGAAPRRTTGTAVRTGPHSADGTRPL